jgi:hypothetical protein
MPIMNTGERVAPVAAVVSAVSTLLCCLPLSFVGALGAASLSTAVLQYRGWLIAASVSLLAIGFIQVYRRSPECRRRSRLSLVVLWTSAIAVTVVLLVPQLVATLLADWLGLTR